MKDVVHASLQVKRIDLSAELVEISSGALFVQLASKDIESRSGRKDGTLAALVNIVAEADYLQFVLSLKLLLGLA